MRTGTSADGMFVSAKLLNDSKQRRKKKKKREKSRTGSLMFTGKMLGGDSPFPKLFYSS